MAAAVTSKVLPPIPEDLPKLLHTPKTPWHMSPSLFERTRKQLAMDEASGKPFTAVQLTNNDPEYAFVLRYFQHQKPPHYGIKNILCVHNPDHTKAFEGLFRGMEEAAKTFPPNWNQEEPKAHRAQTIERWKASVAPFSPFQIPSSKRTDTFTLSKIVPLWHGSKQIDSICKIGFTFFGKHHFFDKTAKAGSTASTDIGYFGSGIYFTNSAHYASMYHSGSLLLSWVSMREPYPVVNDVPIPKKGSDMLKLQGKHAYQTYNAHYIPVTSIDPKEPENMVYHPCYQTEQPAWDEYIVFEKSQALPRFIVELGVDLPVAPSSAAVATVEALIDQLMILLDKPEIQSDSVIYTMLSEKSNALLNLNPNSPLSSDEMAFYNRTLKLLDPTGKIRPFIKQQFIQLQPAVQKPNAKEDSPSLAKVTKAATATTAAFAGNTTVNQKTEYEYNSGTAAFHSAAVIVKSLIPPKPIQKPAIAFGKEDWQKFGDIGEEPPLPSNIDQILKSLCPYFSGKTVEQTHMLVLIPKTLNGQPLTLTRLGEVMHAHDSKLAESGYSSFNDSGHGNKPFGATHWVLMTKDVLVGSKGKKYTDQQDLVARNPKYQVPKLSQATTCIFVEYMKTGQRHYNDAPITFTRCQETYQTKSWQMLVGGFAATGPRIPNNYDFDQVGIAALWKL